MDVFFEKFKMSLLEMLRLEMKLSRFLIKEKEHETMRKTQILMMKNFSRKVVKRGTRGKGVSREVEACFNRLTKVSNVEPFAYEDE